MAEYIYTISDVAGDTPNVDGGYGDWSDWTECDQLCGEGSQFRERSCNNPLPQGSGSDCERLGESSESRTCMIKECPVDGAYSKWSEFSKCSATCGGGLMKRTRTCTNPEPSNGGKRCEGPTEESQSCGTDPCPVNGGFTEWSKFDECTVTCGGGTQRRERSCTKPAPANGGADCEGLTEETKSCNTNACPVDGVWASWGAYGPCSKECGEGLETKQRTCSNPAPMHSGKKCQGSGSSSRKCIKKQCPVNGLWSSWSSYSKCSKTCKGGQQFRTRSCTNPAPKHNGKGCVGLAKQVVSCNQNVRCPYYTAYHSNHVCEGGSMKMWCTDKKQVIKLAEYWYGRTNKSTCKRGISWFWSTKCKHHASRIYSECQNKNSCRVHATNSWMRKDPCRGTYKYYYVKFRCYG